MLVFATNHKIAAEPISITISINSKLSGVIVPKIATGNPRTMHILKILLPMILPTNNSFSPLRAAVLVVTYSGNEVPKATIVRAMIRSEIPIAAARVEAESTTN